MIKSLIIILLFLTLISFVGGTIIRLCRITPMKDDFSNVFVNMLLGLVTLVSIYSIFVTKGNTISLGIVAILIMCLIGVFVHTHTVTSFVEIFSKIFNIKIVVSVLILTLALFIFHAFFFFNSPYNNEVHFDYFCYSALGDCMVNRGVESLNCENDLLCEVDLSPTPYHYFDIWLAMFIAAVANVTSAEAMFVEAYVIMAVLCALGFIAIVRCYSQNLFVQIIAFSSILLGGIVCADTSIGSNILNFTQRTHIIVPLCNTKTIAIALFMTASILAFICNKMLFYYIAMAVPLICITVTPAVYSGLGCMMLYDLFWNDKEHRKQIVNAFATLFAMALFILGFYFLQGDGAYAMDDFSLRIVIENITTGFADMCKSVVKFPIFFMLYHLVFLLIIFYLYRKELDFLFEFQKLKSLFIFVVVMETVAFTVSLCYKGNWDCFQFIDMPTLFLVPVYVLLFALPFRYIGNIALKIVVGVMYVLLLVVSIMEGYYQTGLRGTFYDMKSPDDVAYIQAIEKEFVEKHKNKVGVGIRDVYDDAFPYRTRVGLPYQFCPQIPTLNLKTINICTLTPIRPEWQNEETENRRNNNTFTRFAIAYQQKYGQMLEDSLQLAFVKQNKIEFMIVVDGQTMPEIFTPYIDTIFSRPNKTEKFIFFKEFEE